MVDYLDKREELQISDDLGSISRIQRRAMLASNQNYEADTRVCSGDPLPLPPSFRSLPAEQPDPCLL
jgi:hypothetical protein